MRLNEITFETRLKYEDIIEIVKRYVNSLEESYEIDTENILYDPNSYVTKEPIWEVFIISKKDKEIWPDAYISLAISDKERRLVYIQNDHGVVIKRF